MAKKGNSRITERQLRILEMRYQGKALSEIGERLGITAEGVRINVNFAARLISKHGLDALPDGCSTSFTVEQLASTCMTGKTGQRPLAPDNNHNEPDSEPQPNSAFLRINGRDFSFEHVAKALGLSPRKEGEPFDVMFCQRVDAGVLAARSFGYGGDYPGIDIELQLPEQARSLPVMISRTEQPRSEGGDCGVRTYCYGRQDEYFMYFDADTRPDHEVDEHAMSPSVVIGGNPGCDVDIWAENNYIKYRGGLPLALSKEDAPDRKPSLDSTIQSANTRTSEQSGQNHTNIKTHENGGTER